MSGYRSSSQYLSAVERRARLPEGFRAATTSLTFVPREKPKPLSMNLALLLLEEPSSRFAGVFTRNRFVGAPVLIGRQRMRRRRLQGVLINNRVANVGVSGGGEDAEQLCGRLGGLLGLRGELLLPASTGVVGWRLPVAEMREALPGLVAGLQRRSAAGVARAIMTTDSYPKLHRERVGEGSIVGLAKGAGMIEPNMGTMLAFLLTDLAMERAELRRCLGTAVAGSFNRISVDGDQSTSDMAILLSSGRRPPVAAGAFLEALLCLCGRLAEDVVRNGEGVGHVIRVRVEGAPSEALALGAGKAVVNSPLVKTAVFGNDPNVGRIVAALGDFFGSGRAPFDPAGLTVTLGGVEIYRGGSFALDAGKESRLSRYLGSCALDPEARGYPAHGRCVEVGVRLGAGGAAAEVLGADLSYQYVKENADYRS
jgi:glutamate N-acetyltransferase/amino-acid N-acetyltransferase